MIFSMRNVFGGVVCGKDDSRFCKCGLSKHTASKCRLGVHIVLRWQGFAFSKEMLVETKPFKSSQSCSTGSSKSGSLKYACKRYSTAGLSLGDVMSRLGNISW